jgi:hypothetical protein
MKQLFRIIPSFHLFVLPSFCKASNIDDSEEMKADDNPYELRAEAFGEIEGTALVR